MSSRCWTVCRTVRGTPCSISAPGGRALVGMHIMEQLQCCSLLTSLWVLHAVDLDAGYKLRRDDIKGTFTLTDMHFAYQMRPREKVRTKQLYINPIAPFPPPPLQPPLHRDPTLGSAALADNLTLTLIPLTSRRRAHAFVPVCSRCSTGSTSRSPAARPSRLSASPAAASRQWSTCSCGSTTRALDRSSSMAGVSPGTQTQHATLVVLYELVS